MSSPNTWVWIAWTSRLANASGSVFDEADMKGVQLGCCPETVSTCPTTREPGYTPARVSGASFGGADLSPSPMGVASDVAKYFEREMPGCVYKTGPIHKQVAA